ncbi:hypothetical protein Asfd1_14 [Aeromonas phage Asfd_1]|nr:hypothetical protein Asfd1_14 [Aeromonas phage Asfd_1]
MIKAVIALGVPSDFHKNGIFAFGKDNDLPWGKIPEDFKLFREKTMGTVCVMGAKTFQSLPKNLPGRVMVVVGDIKRECRNQAGELPEMIVNQDINWLDSIQNAYPQKDVCLIGGLNFVLSNLNKCDEIHINFLMLKDNHDTINPTIYIHDYTLAEYLEDFPVISSNRIETSVDFCTSIKVGVWK